MRKLSKLFTLIPLLGMLTGCASNDPSPANQRKFNRLTDVEYNTLDDVVYFGEGQGRNCPSTGNVNVFVVPVEFLDFPADEIGKYYNSELVGNRYAKRHLEGADQRTGRGKEAAKEDIRKVYFGDADETQWHSLRSYYLEASYGRLSFGGLVADWYKVYTDFETQEQVTAAEWANASSAASLANFILKDYTDETVKKYHEFLNPDGSYMFNSAKEFLQYFDSNEDGYFDLIEIVYSAPFYAATYNDSNKGTPIDNDKFWAYCGGAGRYATGRKDAPVLNKYAFQSYYTFVEGGLWYEKTDETGQTREVWRPWTCEEICDGTMKVDAHTVTHETGHGLGLPDYYDYNQSYNPAGKVDMMDHNIGDHNSHSKALYGWVEPIIVTGPTQVTIRSFVETGDCIYVPYRGYFNDHKHEGYTFHTEYLAIELYTPTGVNQADSEHHYRGSYPLCPTIPGVKVYHVDARLANVTYNNRTGVWEVGSYTETLTHSDSTVTRVATSNTSNQRVEDFWELKYMHCDSTKTVELVTNESLWQEGDVLNNGENYPDFEMNEYYPTSSEDEDPVHIPFGYRMVIDSVSSESATITFYAA